MSRRGRTELVYEESDDSSGYYEVPAPPRHRSRSRIRVIDDKYEVRPRMKAQHLHSFNDVASSYEREPENVIIHNHLGVPQQARPRASSTGAAPHPNYIPVYLPAPAPERDVSQTRIKHYKEKRYDYSGSSDDSDRKHGRRRSRRPSSRNGEALSAETMEKLARLKLIEEQQQRDAEKERMKKYQEALDPATAEKLFRLKLYEEEQKKKSREDEDSIFMSRLEEKKRKEKDREERLKLEYEEARRRDQAAQKDAIEKAEIARAKAAAEAKEEHDRIIAAERDRAAKDKAEKARIVAEVKAQAAEAKAEREKIWAEERARIEREKKEAEEERKRIMAEEKARAEKAKKEAEEERKRIIFEEEERKKKEKAEWEETKARVMAEKKKEEEEAKAKKKAEDAAFNQKVKEKFMAKGYNPNYIDDVLEEKTEHGRKVSTSRASANSLALEMARPTYIRVKIRHVHPETLEHYQLPWEYDPHDDEYILIKEYIDHDFQNVLFQHTKRLYKQRETRLITDGYTKETVTTLKPNVFKDKDKDEMYLVRRKSTGKSPSRPGRNWMFT